MNLKDMMEKAKLEGQRFLQEDPYQVFQEHYVPTPCSIFQKESAYIR